ncbi:MAG: cytochrome c oxidase subunit II [Novosphingobium sp.]
MRKSIIVCAALLAGCNSHQSALAPFGLEARSTLTMTMVLVIGAFIIAVGMALVFILAVRAPEGRLDHAGGMRMVLWLGAIVPTVVLTALLVWALPAMRPLPDAAQNLRVHVEGEQFWWRVRYRPQGRPPLISANEVRIPVGRTVVFELTAADVIHSFWIPGLAGKMDMIPGRTNRLVVKADKAGTYRGVCAEFCGLSHALMAFDVIAMEPAAFDAWLTASRDVPVRTQGRAAALFAANGCAACHSLNGGQSEGSGIGPDLTSFGERRTLGAGILAPTVENTAAFIRDPHKFKPGARMPSYAAMPEADALAIARWLKEDGR